MSITDRRLMDIAEKLKAKERELKTHRQRIITAVGGLGTARQLRDADLDDLLTDVTSLSTLKAEVEGLLDSLAELGRS